VRGRSSEGAARFERGWGWLASIPLEVSRVPSVALYERGVAAMAKKRRRRQQADESFEALEDLFRTLSGLGSAEGEEDLSKVLSGEVEDPTLEQRVTKLEYDMWVVQNALGMLIEQVEGMDAAARSKGSR